MNRFERDLLEALDGNEREVLEQRKKELNRIYSEGRACRNGFRRQCLAQEYIRLKAEYDYIDGQF